MGVMMTEKKASSSRLFLAFKGEWAGKSRISPRISIPHGPGKPKLPDGLRGLSLLSQS
jgi:hypothetical protein